MAGHPKSQSVRIFSEKMDNYNDQSLADFLFPINDSEAPRITQRMAAAVRSSENLKKRVENAFLRLMKRYGFYRLQVKPLRIRLRPKDSKVVNWAAPTWLSDKHPEHSRISRMILLLRIFDLEHVAQAFHAALTSEPQRITSRINATIRSQWDAALNQNISEFPAEDSSDDTDSTESSGFTSLFNENDDNAQGEPLSSEQQHLLERLIKDGAKKFAGRKRSRDEEEGNDNEPPRKRQKSDQVTWDHVRQWLEGYKNPEFTLTWTKVLHQRMEARREAYNEAIAKPNSKSIIKHKLPYLSDVVPWAVGSLWAPLHETVPFGFGTSGLFDKQTRKAMSDHTTDDVAGCGQRHTNLMIPMFFPSAAQEKDALKGANHVGHLLLVLATKTIGNYDDASINVYNSLPSWFGDSNRDWDEEIEEEAQKVLHASNWLARPEDQAKPQDRPYRLTKRSVTVPIQGSLKHACGLHTVLTAWAILLDIPLHEQHRRRGNLSEENFLSLGTEIVNLAVAGYMDSLTIQAFLNASGMTTEQDVKDESVRVASVETSLMNDSRLKGAVNDDGALDEVWWLEQQLSQAGPG